MFLKSFPLTWLFFLCSFVNFGPITGGKVTFSIIAVIGHLLYLLSLKILFVPRNIALIFTTLLFYLVCINFAVTIFDSNFARLSQLINYFFMFAVFISGYNVAVYSKDVPVETSLSYIFWVGVLLANLSLFVFVYGFFNIPFVYSITHFFNNANTFDLGGIAAQFSLLVLPRVTGFSPEPSFWSIYLATIFAIGRIINKSYYSVGNLSVLVVLLLTFGRTGYFALILIIVYIFTFEHPLRMIFMFFICVIAFILGYGYFQTYELDLSAGQRIGSIFSAIEALPKFPFLGGGFGAFKAFAHSNDLDYPVVFNYFLHLSVEAGLVGFCLSFFLFFSIVSQIRLRFRIVIIPFFVMLLSSNAYNLGYFWLLFGFLVGKSRKSDI